MFLKSSENVGKLEVVCGSMFSGKSEELIRRIRRVNYAKQSVIVFKHSIDKRYGENGIFSHNMNSIDAYPVASVNDMEEIMKEKSYIEVIGIDEVQFFGEEVVNFCKKYIKRGKRIIVAGLDLDFKAVPFIPMPELMAIADNVTKLKAKCVICGKDAYASQRLINGEPAFEDDPIVMVGAKENYEARCRRHHIVRKREEKFGKIYFLFGTNINAGKEDVEKYILSKNKNCSSVSISVFNEGESISDVRKKIKQYSLEYDIVFIRIVKSPLIPIQENYTIIDLMMELRQKSSVILISRNRKGMINEVLISYEIINKADLNIESVIYTKSIDEKYQEENIEVIENINNILNIKAIIL